MRVVTVADWGVDDDEEVEGVATNAGAAKNGSEFIFSDDDDDWEESSDVDVLLLIIIIEVVADLGIWNASLK